MTNRVLARLIRGAEARAERLAAAPPPGMPEREPPSFKNAIGGRTRLSVIAEFKRKSPSAGAIRDDDPAARAVAYRKAGASAVSVLTDPDAFGGCLEDLQAASVASSLPILMKDFVVDPVQVRAGWAAGASAVLLIVRCLDEARLQLLYGEARSLGLDVLVEVHDAAELDRALALPEAIVGINNRDLDTLETDRRRAAALLPRVPSARIAVAESGYLEPAHLGELRGRADAVLIGTALMRAPDPSAFLRTATEPALASV